MSKNLVIFLGAGATAAISDCKLPTASNFFDKNDVWHNNINNYPHLEVVCEKVRKLKEDSHPTLTDVWLFIDTFAKYHLATYFNNREYDKKLLLKRWDTITDIPYYLTQNYLNQEFANLSVDMRPLFSKLDKQIYHRYSHNNLVEYFYTLAGWELRHLLYKTYVPQYEQNKLYKDFLKVLETEQNNDLQISVINFNWDTYFELACYKSNKQLTLNPEKAENKILLCKPHGGWNIRHVNDEVIPYKFLYESVLDSEFDNLERIIRPAMIPYFIGPDEISDEHNNVWPDVGQYFLDQQKSIEKIIEKASHIISIGYSFSKDDHHIRKIVEGLTNRQNKQMLCVIGDKKDDYDNIKTLWKIDGNLNGYRGYFTNDSINEIKKFL